MSGPETQEPTAWQHPADSDKDEDDVADHDTDEGADDDGYKKSKDEDGDEEDDKDGDEDDDDEQYNRNSGSRVRSVNHKHIARPLTRLIEESGHSQDGADAVAAFHKYSLQGETSEIRMIEFSDLQIPPEHLARLLDPFSSDARVRAYFRGVSEEINKKAIVPGRGDAYAQTAAHLIFDIMQREIAQSDPRRQDSARVSHTLVAPDLYYALAKALLASNRVKDAIAQLQQGLISAKDKNDPRVFQACQRLLVYAWRKSGDPGQAIFLLEHVFEQQHKQLGWRHPSVHALQQALAAAYEANQQTHKAIPLLKQVIEVQGKTHGQHNRPQLITLHLLLRSQTNAGHEAEANTTVSHILGVINRSNGPLAPLQEMLQFSGSPTAPSRQSLRAQQLGYAANIVTGPSHDNSSLQRLIDHVIDSQPQGVSVPSELQACITAYTKSKHVSSNAQLSPVSNGSSPLQYTQALHLPHNSNLNFTQPVPAMAMSSASSTLVQTTVTGAAQVSGSTALAVAGIGLSGVLGMIAGGLYKIHVVDKPQVEVLQQAEQREARTAEVDEHQKTLDLIKSVRLAEEELVRKDADTAERERQLEQIAANYKHEIGELRKQIEVMGRRKKAEYRDGVQGSGRSEGTRSQQAKEIIRLKAQLQRSIQSDELRVRHAVEVESLEQQLKACRAKLSKAEEHRERCICTTCQKSDQRHSGDTPRATEPPNHYSLESEDEDSAEPGEDSNDFSEPEENSDLPGSGYEMAILKPATARSELERYIRSAVDAKHVAEATLTCAQSELNNAQAKAESQQSEIDALNLQLMAMQCERNHSDTLPVTEDTTHRRSDTSHVEECPSCARSRSVISALRERLGEEFGDEKVRFLRKLDPTNNVDELVAVLCERLNAFTQALHKELLPLHERNTKSIEAERKITQANIADYVQKLGESRCKESRLEHQLAEARSELSEALDKFKTHDSPPAQQEPVQQAAPWVRFRWPFNQEAQGR